MTENVNAQLNVGPIFIVGAGHSGTSLVERTLRRVEGLWSPGVETNWAIGSHGTCVSRLADLQRKATANNNSRLVEKSPNHDRALDIIFELCPNARVLFVVRDPRDVVASRTSPPRCETVNHSVQRWSESIKQLRRWRDNPNPDPRVFLLRYESLVQDPKVTLDKVAEFAGVEIPLTALVDPTALDGERLAFNGVTTVAESVNNIKHIETPIASFPTKHVNRIDGEPNVGSCPLSAKQRQHALAQRRSFQINSKLVDYSNAWRSVLDGPTLGVVEQKLRHHMQWLGYQLEAYM
eukprot:m.80557 g.80557  ORF g.80557 m.80557 type:complete len:293 (+) comp25321_c0_seq1:102-980(+)